MRAVDIIMKKRNGLPLTEDEISFFIGEYTKGNIPDYQVSAFLMAVYFNGLDDAETTNLTMVMRDSGEQMNLSNIHGVKVDKHSTGGVGDKTSLIIGPIVAACGGKFAKMSGRGLGHTGGTIDKLESIPGFQTEISYAHFIQQVNEIGISIMAQTNNIVPADKKLYALRDVTATVENPSLIASSIMSKKLALGSDVILLDVKVGSGAFMKNLSSARELAKKMVAIGTLSNRKVTAFLTNMDMPLGFAIGNALEIQEVIAVLNGEGPEDLTNLCIQMAAALLEQALMKPNSDCIEMAKEALGSKKALEKLAQMVQYQDGDSQYIYHPERFEEARNIYIVKSQSSGYVSRIETQVCGEISAMLGAGHMILGDTIDFSAGIYLKKKIGDPIEKGEAMAVFYSNRINCFDNLEKMLLEAYSISKEKINAPSIILDIL